MLEPQRRSNATLNIPNNQVQLVLDKVNTVLAKEGYILRPNITMKKCGPITRFIIKKLAKYLTATFVLQFNPASLDKKPMQVSKVKLGGKKKGKKK